MLESDLKAYIETHGLLQAGERVVVGLSGGVDSVVLTYLLHKLGYKVYAAHVNYGLRGMQSDEDEAFVRAFTAGLRVPLHVQHPDTRAFAQRRGLSVQEAARDIRYAFFQRVAQEEEATKVAVAHHLDDQAETILLNLFRGSGLEGLAGMPVKRKLGPELILVRPLLFARREEIEAYAREKQLLWREDPSNESLVYRRSALRREIIPRVKALFGDAAIVHVAHAGRRVRAYLEATIEPALKEHWERVVYQTPVGVALRVEPLRQMPPILRRRLLLEVLRRYAPDMPQSEAMVKQMEALLEAQAGKKLPLGSGVLWREREALVWVTRPVKAMQGVQVLEPGKEVETPLGRVVVEEVGLDEVREEPFTEYIDADKVTGPLLIRAWEPGDAFQPLGMKHSKKISDFLTDIQVPSYLRAAVPVVLAGDQIIWVVGYRISERVKRTPHTQRVLRLRLIPHDVMLHQLQGNHYER